MLIAQTTMGRIGESRSKSKTSGIQRRMRGIQSLVMWKCGWSISRTATLGII